jgi:hypothetical protein
MEVLARALNLNVTRSLHDRPATRAGTVQEPEQLSLLPEPPTVPARPGRFRLDDATRRRGLRHVAEIRAQLEHRAA